MLDTLAARLALALTRIGTLFLSHDHAQYPVHHGRSTSVPAVGRGRQPGVKVLSLPRARRPHRLGWLASVLAGATLCSVLSAHGDLQAVPTHQAPTIDGDLSDAVWSAAPVCTTFTQREPIEGATPSQRTQIRVLFDDGYLYFAIRNHDTDPARMLATHMRRDDRLLEDDSIHIILDTYNNRRGGYHFGTNSLGAQQDALLLDEGRSRNEAWDAVWESRARRDSLGWSVEIAIPFGQLRYDEGGEGIWGINVGRRLPRDNEEVYLVPPPQSFGFGGGFRTSRLASLRGLTGLKRRTQLEVTPYLLPGTRREFDGLDPDEDPFVDMGADVRTGLFGGLTLDLSYNTDFAQVETDQEEVNLTRFSLFLPEQRGFFLEGAGIFALGERRQRFGGRPPTVLFYSRRIGIQDGYGIPVTYGAKLTGRVGAYEVGLLNSMTDPAVFRDGVEQDEYLSDTGDWYDDDALDDLSDREQDALSFIDTVIVDVIDTLDVDRTVFTVARVKRDILGRSNVGIMLADRSPGEDEDYNRTAGVDANLSFLDGSVNVMGFAAQSWTPGLSGQDRAAYVELDRRWGVAEFNTSFLDVGENFNPEIGFVPRDDVRRFKARTGYRPRSSLDWIRLYSLGVSWTHLLDRDNTLQTRRLNGSAFVNLEAGDWIGIEVHEQIERLDESFEIHDDIDIPDGKFSFTEASLGFFLSNARRIGGRGQIAVGGFFGGTRRRADVEISYKANEQVSLESAYEINRVELPAGSFTTHRASQRMLLTFSTDLYIRGLAQWNSQREVVGGNLLLGYRYKPGSDLFLVYNHLFDTDDSLHQLDRSIQLKLAYYWSP